MADELTRYKAALTAIAHPQYEDERGRTIQLWSAEACRDIALEALEPHDPDDFVPEMIGAFGRRER